MCFIDVSCRQLALVVKCSLNYVCFLYISTEKRAKFDNGEDPLDPEQQHNGGGHPFPGGFNPFGGGGGGGFTFKFHF